ncbi:MAG: hypothetical protein KAS25_02525 [Dehalococcoidales bacterium]|nr:hypothetical protein [Dehalococcoidales bacterium]
MIKNGNILILLFGPSMAVVSLDFLVRDVLRGTAILIFAAFLTVVGSYYQWIKPKNRSKFWLIFPALLTFYGYIPLIVLRKRKKIFNRLSRGFEKSKSNDLRDSYTNEAAKTTKYYLELRNNYRNRFNDEASLLAAAGILNLKVARSSFLEGQEYLDKIVSLTQVINIAKRSVLAKEHTLVEFIINLEIELFKGIYASEFDISEITESCFEKKKDITSIVQKVNSEYTGESDYSSEISNFMEHSNFRSYREALGINELKQDALLS